MCSECVVNDKSDSVWKGLEFLQWELRGGDVKTKIILSMWHVAWPKFKPGISPY
jgi:hypothetical protein